MTSLPKLPDPDRTMWQYGKQIDHFTADQMREYANCCLQNDTKQLKNALRRILFEASSIGDAKEIASFALSRSSDTR